MSLLLSYYGDDFTGSTDVMEALASNGINTVLFTRLPTQEQFAPFADYPAIGLAGTSRSQPPQWMNEHLPQVFEWLRSLGARLCHYKVCSTFDSSPRVGSIGRAIEIAQSVFGQPAVPLVVGAPQLGRYTFAGHLFARYGGDVWRIDRHPVMSRHPVTPMDEADLRLHLAKQTAQPVHLASGDLREPGIHLIDVFDAATQMEAGERLLALPGEAKPFIVGSSGVEYALVQVLARNGEIAGTADFAPLDPVERCLAVSGSVSPTTERQIRLACANGFTGITADPLKLARQEVEESAQLTNRASHALAGGESVLIHTAMGSASDKGHELDRIPDGRRRLGRALGKIAGELVRRHRLTRLILAGGDSSSHALGELDIHALTPRLPLPESPGSPVCLAHSADPAYAGLEIAMKGGQIGRDDYFIRLKQGGP
ncbi:four-carbon acid sugar kinase family protein [Taklimakanibacter lacteus]|uniref:four-carbon acid sugar kinase family protein n=1 Tax=Taklimakanibacter lacteus TaxID=2268456 RepID=UPI000E673C5E